MADEVIRTYDAKNVIVTFGTTLTGYAEDTFISIARQGNTFETKKGADGTVARANQNSTSFTVKLTLLQTSVSNDYLLSLLNEDMKSNSGVKMLKISEASTGTLQFEGLAWIEKDPDSAFGKGVGDREWTFRTGKASFTGMSSVASTVG